MITLENHNPRYRFCSLWRLVATSAVQNTLRHSDHVMHVHNVGVILSVGGGGVDSAERGPYGCQTTPRTRGALVYG